KDRSVSLNQVKQLRLEYHEADVDEIAVHIGLLTESINNTISTNFHHTLVLTEVVHRHSANLPMGLVEFKQFCDVSITHCVTIGEHKRFITDILPNSLYTPASLRIQACVHHGNLPGLSMLVMDDHFIVT